MPEFMRGILDAGGLMPWVRRQLHTRGEAKVAVADFANDLAILSFTKHPAGKLKILPLSGGPATLGRAGIRHRSA